MTWILAADTSFARGCVALLKRVNQGLVVEAEASASVQASASQSLLPLIDEVMRSGGIDSASIDCFAVGIGPGSFTGIRISMATMKTFAMVSNKPIIGFSSLSALGASAKQSMPVYAVANAYQGLVFVGDGDKEWACEPAALTGDRPWVVTGFHSRPDLLTALKTRAAEVSASIGDEDAHLNGHGMGRAIESTMTATGARFEADSDDGAKFHWSKLEAHYLRPSQATLNLEKVLRERS